METMRSLLLLQNYGMLTSTTPTQQKTHCFKKALKTYLFKCSFRKYFMQTGTGTFH